MTLSPASVAPPIPSFPRASFKLALQRAGSCLIVVIALADFVRWQAVATKRISFGQIVPMAPASEWLFVALGVALGLQLFFPAQPIARRISAVLSAIAALAALHVLFCHLHGHMPRWESWLGFGGTLVEGFSVGYISTQSAVLSLLSNFALLALLSPLAGHAVWRDAGIFAALAVEFFALATVVSYAAGNPPVSNDGWLKVAPLVMLEFTLFNFVLLMSDRSITRVRHWFFGTDVSAPDFAPLSREEKQVFGLLAAVGLVALTASLAYLRIQTKRYEELSVEALQRIADLKVGQIEQWRGERLGDARSLMRMPGLGGNVQAVSESNPTAQRARFIGWFRQYVRNYGYANVVLFDKALQPVLSEPGGVDLPRAELRERLRTLRPDSDVIELPPYADAAGRLHWDILAPLPDSETAALEGAILLQTNPTRFIIPILQSWPAEYQTGQSVLWYRDGDRLVSLGGYRPAPGVLPEELRPLGITRQISKLPPQSLPARIVRGETDGGEGLDYRGMTIVGVGRAIRNSPWLFSSRLDSREVYEPLRQTALGVTGILVGFLATTGLATSWLGRQRQNNLLHERVSAELEQKRLAARLGLVMRHAKDIILVTDGKMRFVDVNQQALDTYGWTKEELLQMTIPDLRAAETTSTLPEVFERANSAEGVVFETIHQRKDGTKFPVEISVRRVEIDARPHLLAIIRDITKRRADQVRIEQLGRLYRVLSQIHEVIFRATDREELLHLVCQTLVESGRFKFASIRWHDPQWKILERVAQHGQGSDHSAVIEINNLLEAGGPSGTAFRENRTYICNDVFADPNLIPWRQANEATGTASCVAIPVRRAAAVVAVLTVYAGHKNSFGVEETALLEKAAANLSFALDKLAEIERRQASDEALRASEERYRLIADNTSDLIWLNDQTSDRFTYASPAALPLLGYLPEEIVGRKLLDFVAPSSEKAANHALEQAVRSAAETRARVHVVVELELRRKDGSFVPTEVVTSLLSDASGRVTHILGVTRDISERRRAREALEKFNTQLEQQVEARTAELAARNHEIEALVDSIPDTVLLCDERGELVTSHFADGRASSFPFASAGGSDWLSNQHPVLIEIARELHTVAWAGKQTVMVELDRNIDGVDYSIEARATPAGEKRLLILLRDISARKRIERAGQANLERERQLSEMKTQFISVASHEFRTPLAAATGSLELLERHAARITEAKRLELLTRAQRSLGRLTAIMNDVLQLSRADSGRVKVKRMPVDLVQFAQDIIREVEAGDRQQHEFSFQNSGDGEAVPVDTNLLNHILSNLLGNAVRYSPPGTKISVTLDIGEQAFSLTIADEGIGIPEAERERVFEPFARGSNVGQINGTGLGLNIVKRYTELLGGQIELLPTERGAAFRVRVPLHQPTA